ncbi:MAG: TlpA family protein disulfide reductase [Desulfobacterales bacterium]|nr:TlpA family protein disulfide reductase [Desulfobacterales bacterium]
MNKKMIWNVIIILSIGFLAMNCYCEKVFSADLPQKGTVLPSIQFIAPPLKEHLKYLGVKDEKFELKDIHYKVLLIEVIGVYCPYCVEQVPLFTKLFNRLQKNKLDHKVKMLGVTAGGAPMEVKFLQENGGYKFPLVPDESFAIHKLLGEPRTPFTMLVNKRGEVLYTHLGIVKDINSLYKLIQTLSE